MTTAQQLINQGISQGMEIKEIMTIKKGIALGLNVETISVLVDESV